jgi:hypothetical protein
MLLKNKIIDILMGRRKRAAVAIGQRYKKRDAPWPVWEIALLTTGTDGTSYVQITRVDDRTIRKTVARSTLESGIEYIRIRGV